MRAITAAVTLFLAVSGSCNALPFGRQAFEGAQDSRLLADEPRQFSMDDELADELLLDQQQRYEPLSSEQAAEEVTAVDLLDATAKYLGLDASREDLAAVAPIFDAWRTAISEMTAKLSEATDGRGFESDDSESVDAEFLQKVLFDILGMDNNEDLEAA